MTTDRFIPPAAEGLPEGALDSATEGANRLDAWALDPRGRNFLAHALVQLARDGWLRTVPAAVPVPPPADQTALRDRIADALYRHEWPGKQVWVQALAMDREVFEAMADAVLAVLPEQTDRAAVRAAALREAADFVGIDDDCDCGGCDSCVPNKLADELRRMAAEEQPAETPMFGSLDCTCIPFTRQGGTPRYCGPTDTVDMISGWEIGRDCPHHKPAVGEQPETQETPPATVHAIPLPGSNGISACCGRPPCEFVGERVTRDPDEVTCRGPE